MKINKVILTGVISLFTASAFAGYTCKVETYKQDLKISEFQNEAAENEVMYGDQQILNEYVDSERVIGIYLQQEHYGRNGGSFSAKVKRLYIDFVSEDSTFTSRYLTKEKAINGNGQIMFEYEGYKTIVTCSNSATE